jgi:hypothetical protein
MYISHCLIKNHQHSKKIIGRVRNGYQSVCLCYLFHTYYTAWKSTGLFIKSTVSPWSQMAQLQNWLAQYEIYWSSHEIYLPSLKCCPGCEIYLRSLKYTCTGVHFAQPKIYCFLQWLFDSDDYRLFCYIQLLEVDIDSVNWWLFQ